MKKIGVVIKCHTAGKGMRAYISSVDVLWDNLELELSVYPCDDLSPGKIVESKRPGEASAKDTLDSEEQKAVEKICAFLQSVDGLLLVKGNLLSRLPKGCFSDKERREMAINEINKILTTVGHELLLKQVVSVPQV